MRSETANIASAKVGGSIFVIMAKAVRPGAVKTCVATCLSSDAITGLYRCSLEDTIDLARSLDGVETAIMSPAADVDELRCVADGSKQVVAQRGPLAAGLESVFDYFSAEGQRRIIAFNSDSLHLPVSVLRQAFEALGSHDLVVGPTPDGGYYLVGAKASHPGLFAPSALGTTSALAALLACAQRLRLSVHTTDEFYDIDLPADVCRLAEELRFAPERVPRTARWLGDWSQTAEQSLAAGANP